MAVKRGGEAMNRIVCTTRSADVHNTAGHIAAWLPRNLQVDDGAGGGRSLNCAGSAIAAEVGTASRSSRDTRHRCNPRQYEDR